MDWLARAAVEAVIGGNTGAVGCRPGMPRQSRSFQGRVAGGAVAVRGGSGQTGSETFSVVVVNLAGQEVATLKLRGYQSIATVEKLLYARLGGQAEGIHRLVLGTRVLDPRETVAEAGLCDGAVVQRICETLPTFHFCGPGLELLEDGRAVRALLVAARDLAFPWVINAGDLWALAFVAPTHRRLGFRFGLSKGCECYSLGVLPQEQLTSPTGRLSLSEARSTIHISGIALSLSEPHGPSLKVVVDFDPVGVPGGQVRYFYKDTWTPWVATRFQDVDQVCMAVILPRSADSVQHTVTICSPDFVLF